MVNIYTWPIWQIGFQLIPQWFIARKDKTPNLNHYRSIFFMKYRWRIKDFPDRDTYPKGGDANLLFWPIFYKKCMKLKKKLDREQGHASRAPSHAIPWIRRWILQLVSEWRPTICTRRHYITSSSQPAPWEGQNFLQKP